MSDDASKSSYWTRVDHFKSTADSYINSSGSIYTYEHVLPTGKLILTEHRWQSRIAATVIFVANPVTPSRVGR